MHDLQRLGYPANVVQLANHPVFQCAVVRAVQVVNNPVLQCIVLMVVQLVYCPALQCTVVSAVQLVNHQYSSSPYLISSLLHALMVIGVDNNLLFFGAVAAE